MEEKRDRQFKKPLLMVAWLDAALKMEKEKYEKCPVRADMVPGHEAAQGWGYVVAGYSLMEQAFKGLLHVRGKDVSWRHSLCTSFQALEDNDREILREYYADYRATIGGMRGAFPLECVDQFLENLDGDHQDRRGRTEFLGSFDWRYYLIEEKRSREMPLVSVDYMYELVFGCIRTIEGAAGQTGKASKHTRSIRMYRDRMRKYDDWVTVRMNSDAWKSLGDRVEILWGPDYRGNYDVRIHRDQRWTFCLAKNPEGFGIAVVDKRDEVNSFDVIEGYRSIGVQWD